MNARREEEAPYETRFNPNLPWGYWLVATGETDGWPPLADLDGRRWNSVRECFWISRLGMASIARDDKHRE